MQSPERAVHACCTALRALKATLDLEEHPRLAAAIRQLEEAMAAELDIVPFLDAPQDGQEAGPIAKRACSEHRRMQMAIVNRDAKCTKLEAKLAELCGEKGPGGRLHNIWFARIALVQPTITAEELKEWSKTFAGGDVALVSRFSVENARCAIAEVLKSLNEDQVCAAVGGACASRSGAPTSVVRTCVLHFHDEAGMRVRSYAAADAEAICIGDAFRPTLKRGRASLVLIPSPTKMCKKSTVRRICAGISRRALSMHFTSLSIVSTIAVAMLGASFLPSP